LFWSSSKSLYLGTARRVAVDLWTVHFPCFLRSPSDWCSDLMSAPTFQKSVSFNSGPVNVNIPLSSFLASWDQDNCGAVFAWFSSWKTHAHSRPD
jgi:hypothetical protein